MQRFFLILLLVSVFVPAAQAGELAAVKPLAEQGDTRAQFVLGSMYRDGRGVAQNYDQMFHWWRTAAEGGDFDAQFALGDIYSGGYGVDQDHVMAYMWFDILAAQAKERLIGGIAARNRKAVALFMTTDDIETAKKLSADWQSEHARQQVN